MANKLTNWPNLITLGRILLAPILVLIYYLPMYLGHTLAAIIFVFACLTDWLDGYLARSLKQTSPLGAFLDPIADKLIVAVALVLLVAQPDFRYLSIPAMVIIGREIVVSGLREWMAEMGKRASVAVSYIGKCKAALQMIAIAILLYCKPIDVTWLLITGYVLLYLAAILTIWSMIVYLKAAWPEFNQ